MDGHGSGHWRYGGDKRLEVVSGKMYGSNQTRSPDPAAIPTEANEKAWRLSDPDAKRKKRITKYKVYSVEGKVKATLRKGFRWIKNKCSQIAHGY